MNRWDIINHFITKYNYKSYLEIGYFKGWSFDNVKCDFKIAVDPNPSKVPGQEQAPAGSILLDAPHGIFKMTSNEFFEKIKEPESGLDTMQWDIVFIDGLHEANQVLTDVFNAVKRLTPNGMIVLHDCNPPTYQHVTTGDPGGNWNGDVYKAAFVLNKMKSPTSEFYVIDTDWGMGVLRPGNHFYSHSLPKGWSDREWWERFDIERSEWLNLISVEEFLKREAIHATA